MRHLHEQLADSTKQNSYSSLTWDFLHMNALEYISLGDGWKLWPSTQLTCTLGWKQRHTARAAPASSASGKSGHLRVLPSMWYLQNAHDGSDPAYSQCWDGTQMFSRCNKLRKGDFISAKQKKANEPRSQQQNTLQVVALREAHP